MLVRPWQARPPRADEPWCGGKRPGPDGSAAVAAVVPGTTARRILGRRIASLCLASVACQPIEINDPRVSDDGYPPVTYRERSRWLGTEGD